ncbi:hypothetical protein [Paenarthrobacter nitroguajacolicus]|uniref:hypothetical protein n=1 Tax=Paenarthrobacter nitroguajacolicus TaxID=211146 RepID=UPI00248B0A4F|nr:hypothetical protein [Paenarthrobacter nitroguajacolicus]MDI2034724.1 hypothetical protein [Paenarthrobacter nitroguajacolicus]
MNQRFLVWLMLALILGFYSVYVFTSGGSESVWPVVSGVICAVAACLAFWRSMRERKADRG